MPGGNESSYLLKKTRSFKLQACLSMSDLLLTSRIKVLTYPNKVNLMDNYHLPDLLPKKN